MIVEARSALSRATARALVTFVCFVLVGSAVVSPARAEGLEGSWSGSGTVSFATGAQERAKCRAHYSKRSATSYALSATCATPSGKASQTATLRQVGKSSYSGSFHNSEYNVSGTIHVSVNGNSQSVQLSGDGGASASLRLSR